MPRYLALVPALLAGAACASLEPEPCTPEWVDWKSDQILEPFVQTYRSEIAELRRLDGSLDNPGMITAFRMAGLADDIVLMVEDFTQTAVPQLQAAVAQCTAEPDTARQLLVEMLERENVEPQVIAWIDTLGLFLDTVNGARRGPP
ncbi:hypothetical protein AY600_07740 [Phormidium willei BDU 130791]|nr:hypothetical protein AY600_07740 [Phormidium willei BDU 130791]